MRSSFFLLFLGTTLLPLFNEGLLMLRLRLIIIFSKHHLNVSNLETVTVNCALNALFLLRTSYNLFFDSILSNQPIYSYFLCLTNPVRSISSLLIHRGIPIVVIKDDSVCCDQVDSKTPRSG